MSLEMNNKALVFQKTSALLLISSGMHQSVFAVCVYHVHGARVIFLAVTKNLNWFCVCNNMSNAREATTQHIQFLVATLPVSAATRKCGKHVETKHSHMQTIN